MLILNNTYSTNPQFNLALEEALFDSFVKEPILYIWQNSDSIIIGKNQVAENEFDPSVLNKLRIPVVRRNSGGGAVFHDLGNINITYIDKSDSKNFNLIPEGIINFLKENFDIEAQIKGRNDIYINNKKISGWAKYTKNNNTLIHGTLLFNTNQETLEKILTPDKRKKLSKGVQSNRSLTTNINIFLNKSVTIYEFRKLLLDFFQDNFKTNLLNLDNSLLDKTDYLYKEKFSNSNWNFKKNNNLSYSNKRSKKFPFGIVTINYNKEESVFKNISITGDFFFKKELKNLENLLENKTYEEIQQLLKTIEINNYINGINEVEFLSLFN